MLPGELVRAVQHPADCDGSLTVPDAGFGGQDITYQCPHPAHLVLTPEALLGGPQQPPPDPWPPIRPSNPQPPVQVPPPPWRADSATDMAALGVWALDQWRAAPGGSASERRAARSLAFAFGRLVDLGAVNNGPAAAAAERARIHAAAQIHGEGWALVRWTELAP